MGAFQANSWIVFTFGKFVGLCDESHLADISRQLRKAILGLAFVVGLTMKTILAICEFKSSLSPRCRKAIVRATIEHVHGEILR